MIEDKGMSLTCTVPAAANLPMLPAIAHVRQAHRQQSRNIGREKTASPPEAKVRYLRPKFRNDLEIAPQSPATLAGGGNRSKRRKATILVTRVGQIRRVTVINIASGREDHLGQREGVNRDPR